MTPAEIGYRQVTAARGASWMREAWALLMRNPGLFAAMALILTAGQAMPVVNVAMVVFGPALFGGFLHALREQDAGRPVELTQLFQAFLTPGKLGPMTLLCLPGLLAVATIGMVIFLWIGSAFMGFAVGGHKVDSGAWAAGLGMGALVAAALVIAAGFALYAVMFFAVPRVMFDGLAPLAALKESLRATRANLGAMLVFGGTFWLLCVLGFMVSSVIPVLGWALWGIAVTAMAAGSVYAGYRDVYGSATPDAPPTNPPA